MKIYDELKFRGIVAQSTNEEKVENMINEQKITFYMGCDPTADSLHVGHFVQLMVISRLQEYGHHPILLFGGGTGYIGDPSGKNDMRRMMTRDEIEHNVECFKVQASKFLDVSKIEFVNNADWLLEFNYIDFLRDIGAFFNVNKMLTYECYKSRLEDGLTFLELNYMIMQSYDFLYLNRKYNCVLQIGGNDQWSNIISGVELVRKKDGREVFGLTSNLLTKSDGKKMGKTENGAIWLDPNKTSPYEFYQYWRNVRDEDVIKCLKMLSSVDVEKIMEFEKLSGSKLNSVKKLLAYHLTKKIHGKSEADKVEKASQSVFVSKDMNSADIPTKYVSFEGDSISLTDLLFNANITSSKGEARRLISQNGISMDDRVLSLDSKFSKKDLLNAGIVIRKGKKTFFRVKLNENF